MMIFIYSDLCIIKKMITKKQNIYNIKDSKKY